MAFTYYQKTLIFFIIFTGAFHTLSVKFADRVDAIGENGEVRKFNHPFVQAAFMFLGETLCLLVFKMLCWYHNKKADGSIETNPLTKGNRDASPLILIIPALCDVIATSLRYIGLTMTYASSFQMLRGAVIVFTGILSVGFLDRRLGSREWSGIGLVIIGLIIVGITDVLTEGRSIGTNVTITGDLLILCAQVMTAVQMVVEEKFVGGNNVPALQAVGWEGIFGLTALLLAMVPLNYIKAGPPFADNSRGTLEATVDAFVQIGNSSQLLIAVIGIMLTIAFFNFSGLSVTKEISATTRMILSSICTILIWGFSLAFQWQVFHYLQLVGFTVLVLGMCFYTNLFIPILLRKFRRILNRGQTPDEEESIINARSDDLEGTDKPFH
ncbi:solute carrier family 35 member F6-like [Belonocnema kinseyi]|uniref:solute carrier family 35 member F6-like n=1 Tax=Belonocnema kinseyi TaxID=2817044 RepID=UPI00143E0494|nr:solute carrier family 35 member F6-like [Belonocnema kinseyi]